MTLEQILLQKSGDIIITGLLVTCLNYLLHVIFGSSRRMYKIIILQGYKIEAMFRANMSFNGNENYKKQWLEKYESELQKLIEENKFIRNKD